MRYGRVSNFEDVSRNRCFRAKNKTVIRCSPSFGNTSPAYLHVSLELLSFERTDWILLTAVHLFPHSRAVQDSNTVFNTFFLGPLFCPNQTPALRSPEVFCLKICGGSCPRFRCRNSQRASENTWKQVAGNVARPWPYHMKVAWREDVSASLGSKIMGRSVVDDVSLRHSCGWLGGVLCACKATVTMKIFRCVHWHKCSVSSTFAMLQMVGPYLCMDIRETCIFVTTCYQKWQLAIRHVMKPLERSRKSSPAKVQKTLSLGLKEIVCDSIFTNLHWHVPTMLISQDLEIFSDDMFI